MQVFVITGRTESGDEFVYVVDKELKRESSEIEAFLKEKWPEEYEYVGFVNVSFAEWMDVEVLPKGSK